MIMCITVLQCSNSVSAAGHDIKTVNTNNNQGKLKTPWTDGAQSYPPLAKSDAILPGDVADGPAQKYDNPLKPPKWMMLKQMESPGLPETPPPPPPEQPAPLATPDFHTFSGSWNAYLPRTMNHAGQLNPNVHLLAQGFQQRYTVGITPTNTLGAYYGSLLEMSEKKKKHLRLRGK